MCGIKKWWKRCDLGIVGLENKSLYMNKNLIKKIVFYVFIVIVWYFFVNNIYKNYDSIKNYDFDINIYYLALSIILQVAFVFYKWYIWGYLIKWHEIKLKDLFYIHSLTWLVRYIPWKASYIFARIMLLAKYDISKKQWFVSIIYENVFHVISSFLVGIPLIVYYFVWWLSSVQIYLWLFLCLLSLVFLYKPVFYYFLNMGLKLVKKEKISEKYLLDSTEIFKSVFLFMFWIILSGIAFFFMVKWIAYTDNNIFLPMIWAWSTAFVIWLVAIFSPNGIWVREWILVFFLQFYFPIEISIIISIFSRLWSTLWDGIFYLYALGYKMIFKENTK